MQSRSNHTDLHRGYGLASAPVMDSQRLLCVHRQKESRVSYSNLDLLRTADTRTECQNQCLDLLAGQGTR